MTKTFDLSGHSYRLSGLLTVPQQFDVARALGPAFLLLAMDEEDAGKREERFPRAFTLASGQLPKNDVDAAIATCLATVTRAVGERYQLVQASGQPMFADVSLADHLRMLWHVLDANGLISFFAAPPSGSKAGADGSPPVDGQGSQTGATGSIAPWPAAGAATRTS